MAETIPSVNGITVQGFKSISKEQRIDICPLTLLAGANSSGKSSFLQPLLLLKQTLESPGDTGALLLDGPIVRFTSADQLLSKGMPDMSGDSFSLRIDCSDGSSLETRFQIRRGHGLEVVRMIYKTQNQTLDISPGMTHEAIIALLPTAIKKFANNVFPVSKEEPRWSITRDRCFLCFELSTPVTRNQRSPRAWFGKMLSPGVQFVPLIQSLIHLPGLRGNPLRNYPKTMTGPYFPGTFEQYVASLIYQWQTNKDQKLFELGHELESLGLTWKVTAKAVADTQVELHVGRLPHSQRGGAHDLVSVADVGFGVSQSLPVLVALIAAEPGQLVYLEQPEIHLHPRAQRLLAHSLCRAANRGIVLVVETHSALLLREVQTLVATGQISRNDIRLHWFQRNEQGSTIVNSTALNEEGAYGDWPQDFDLTELEAEQAYLDAVEHKKTLS